MSENTGTKDQTITAQTAEIHALKRRLATQQQEMDTHLRTLKLAEDDAQNTITLAKAPCAGPEDFGGDDFPVDSDADNSRTIPVSRTHAKSQHYDEPAVFREGCDPMTVCYGSQAQPALGAWRIAVHLTASTDTDRLALLSETFYPEDESVSCTIAYVKGGPEGRTIRRHVTLSFVEEI